MLNSMRIRSLELFWNRRYEITYIEEDTFHHPPIGLYFTENPIQAYTVECHMFCFEEKDFGKSPFFAVKITLHLGQITEILANFADFQ